MEYFCTFTRVKLKKQYFYFYWSNILLYVSVLLLKYLICVLCPPLLQCTHLLMATSSRIMHHVTKPKSSQSGFLNMTMSSVYSNGLHSHQISIQESTFGMWWRRDLHHGYTAYKSAATAWCYNVNIDQNLRGMFPTPCWIYATKN